MLALMCEARESRYALESSCVIEVVSYVRLEEIPGMPAWLPGMFVYRGRAVYVADLTHMMTEQSCPRRWNSRIIVANFDLPGAPAMIGLLAERITTAEIDLNRCDSSQEPTEMSTCGQVLLDQQGMFQLIEPSRLFSADRLEVFQAIRSEDHV